MFIDKIKEKKSGLLLYGITPPKIETPHEKILEISERTLARLYPLDIDALVVYDVQDESSRTSEERPFPFIGALDPFNFASGYLQALELPKIIYRPAGKFSEAELSMWLSELAQNQYYPIFVGIPSPDFQPKTSLADAYNIWRTHQDISVMGAITIPERHAVLKDEQDRMLDKMQRGVSYFISQCVFNLDYAKAMLNDLKKACAHSDTAMPTVIFTLTTCGSAKVLRFMEWLGIHVPDSSKNELLAAENILEKSLELSLSLAAGLTEYCTTENIPFGFNIESVAIKKEEIEASIFMVNEIGNMLKNKGLR